MTSEENQNQIEYKTQSISKEQQDKPWIQSNSGITDSTNNGILYQINNLRTELLDEIKDLKTLERNNAMNITTLNAQMKLIIALLTGGLLLGIYSIYISNWKIVPTLNDNNQQLQRVVDDIQSLKEDRKVNNYRLDNLEKQTK